MLKHFWQIDGKKEVYIKIHGRVQGIGFRWWAVKTAEEIGGISGWVHNAADGSVDVLMSGEEENIDKMLLACHSGPPLARVDRVSFCGWSAFGVLPPIIPGVFKRL